MLTACEYLATMSTIAQRNCNLFSNGGELYWPHETLKTGYTTAGFRRVIMSHSDLMDWVLELQQEEERFDIAVQEDKIPITHSRLSRIGWQLRLANPTADPGHRGEHPAPSARPRR